MATWENEFTTPGSSARIWLVLEVNYGAYDIALNRTPITWQLRMEERVNASPWNLNGVSSGAAAVDGTVFSSGGLSYDFRATNATQVVASGSKNVTHENDGTKTISVSASYNGGDSVLGTASLAASLVLPTIPRATNPVLSAYTIDAGVGITIDLSSRASTDFTHDLSYAFEGGSSVSIATGVATSQAFTPPITLLTQIPNSLSGTAVITVVTKNGATTIGTKTVNLTVTVPASAIPDFTLTSVAETVATMVTMMGGSTGPYLKLNSKPIVTLDDPAGYQGSTIASTKVKIGTQPDINGGTWVSGTRTATLVDAITQYGATVSVTITITDTRGRIRVRSTTIEVLNYSTPAATGVQFKRADSGGVDSVLGTYLKIVHSSAVQSVLVSAVQKNALKYRIDHKTKAAGSWTIGSVQTPGGLTYSTPLLQSGFAANTGYDVRLVILDNTDTIAMVVGTLTTAQVAINVSPDGTLVGLGKVAEAGRPVDALGQMYQNDGKAVLDVEDFSTNAETETGTSTTKIVTPASLAALTSTTSRRGLIETATDAEAQALTDTSRAVTPSRLALSDVVGARRIIPPTFSKSGGGTVVKDADGTVRVTANGPTAISLDGILAVNSMTILEIITLTSAVTNNTFRFRKAGVDLSSSNYVFEGVFITSGWVGAQTPGGYGAIAGESLFTVNGRTVGHHILTILGNATQSSQKYQFQGRTRDGSSSTSFIGGGDNNSGTYDHDGITILPGGATTFQVGTEIRVWRMT